LPTYKAIGSGSVVMEARDMMAVDHQRRRADEVVVPSMRKTLKATAKKTRRTAIRIASSPLGFQPLFFVDCRKTIRRSVILLAQVAVVATSDRRTPRYAARWPWHDLRQRRGYKKRSELSSISTNNTVSPRWPIAPADEEARRRSTPRRRDHRCSSADATKMFLPSGTWTRQGVQNLSDLAPEWNKYFERPQAYSSSHREGHAFFITRILQIKVPWLKR